MAGKYNKHKQDGTHLGFPIRMIFATVDLQVTSILPMNFESIVLSVQEKKFKTDFQDGCHSRNLGFPIATIWAILIYESPRCFLPSFKSIGLSVQKKKGKNRFSRWLPSRIPIGTILAIFISTSHSDASCQFSNQLALWFRKISEKKCFKMATMTAILDSDPNNLSYFRSTSHQNTSYQVSSRMAF